MESADAPDEDTIRKIIHDLNGELFLIRGNVELASDSIPDNSPAISNLRKIMDRTEEINAILLRLRNKQKQYEGKTS